MRSRVALVLAVALLLAPAPVPGHAATVSATVSAALGLGYGPLSVQPVSAGIPVYAPGDSLWAQSYSNLTTITLLLVAPNGTLFPAVTLYPGTLANVHTFAQGSEGEWGLYVYIGTGTSQLTIPVLNASSIQPPLLASTGLVRGRMVLGYTMANTTAFDIQACALGQSASNSTTFQLPASIGGSLTVSMNRTTVTFLAPFSQAQFSAWLELYAPRTYSNRSTLATYETMAAQTQVLTLGAGPEPVTARLATDLYLRTGRYDLRVFVRGPGGLAAFDAPYLKTDSGTWVSLAGCTQLVDVTSGSFDVSADLNGTASTWPTTLLMMYNEQGIDSYTMSGVPGMETRIDLGNTTQGALGKVRVGVAGAGVADWEAYGGSIYLIAQSYPLVASVTLSFGNVTSQTLQVTVPGPFSTEVLPLSVGTVDIVAASGGVPIANATVDVAKAGSAASALETDKTGFVSVLLPPGVYTFSVRQDGGAVNETVHVSAGQTQDVTLDVAAPKFPALMVVLAAVLAVGASADVLVWRAYARRRRALG